MDKKLLPLTDAELKIINRFGVIPMDLLERYLDGKNLTPPPDYGVERETTAEIKARWAASQELDAKNKADNNKKVKKDYRI